jgi:hypothetical protein
MFSQETIDVIERVGLGEKWRKDAKCEDACRHRLMR